MLTSHMWLVATVLDSTGKEHLITVESFIRQHFSRETHWSIFR